MDRQEADEIKAHLMQTSEEFRELAQRHQSLDARVADLENNPHATDEDDLEEHRLKKLKLSLKDQMEEMVSRARVQHI